MTASATQKTLVLGLGVSGVAAADLAAQRGAAVTVLDVGDSAALRDRADGLGRRGIDVRLEWNGTTWPDPVDLAILSPGIFPASLLGRLAQGLTCPVISELEFGFRHCSCPLLAVTGTNGKTTTVELLVHGLRHAGYHILAAGNIGRPLCEAARRSADLDFVVTEVSSFQLEHIDTFAPLAAALLNLTPDHLDRYADFDAYRAAKLRLFRNLRSRSRIVLREDLLAETAVQAALPEDSSAPLVFSGARSEAADFFLSADGVLSRRGPDGVVTALLSRAALKLTGRHNLENVLAALALAQAAGIDPAALVEPFRGFVPSAHRLELVSVFEGIRFVNDSKATNPEALRQALLTTAAETSGRILLLAGGVDKDANFTPLRPLLHDVVKEVFLIGRCRERLAKEWEDVVSCKMFMSLAAAVTAALEGASSGDTILLSPGCASQDMFADYAERGREFCALVKRRIGE